MATTECTNQADNNLAPSQRLFRGMLHGGDLPVDTDESIGFFVTQRLYKSCHPPTTVWVDQGCLGERGLFGAGSAQI